VAARRRARLALLALCALLAGLAGCGGEETVVVTATLPPTSPPPPPPPPTAPPTLPTAPTTITPPTSPTGPGASVLLDEDWSDGAGGWPEPVAPRSRAGWDAARMAYLVVVDAPEIRRQVLAPVRGLPTDVRVQVTAMLVEGDDGDSDYRGIMCRSDDNLRNYYGFLVRTDGTAAIARYDEGERTLLGSGAFETSPAIVTGRGARNVIAAECAGDNLTLFVNDQQVVSVSDDRLTGDRVGLTASSGAEGGKAHEFDDVVITG